MTSPLAAIDDRYRIERQIGAGGMATVYLAQDLKHRRPVAIKVLHPELSAVIGVERFLKEIELTASLQHPHILPLFDSGEAGGLLFYAMPYVEGETLRDRLEREQQLPVAEAVRIASDVADALEYAHRRGLVHRDIKPENILLHEGRPLLADFGIALAVQQAGGERMTQTGLSLGTPTYMAPEQAMGERNVDARADVYALGSVLYEMLSGEPPFTGPNAQAIVARVLTERPVPLRVRRERVPAHVGDAVMTALEKLPADRFPSAAAFSRALADAAYASAGGDMELARARVVATPVLSRPALAIAVGVLSLLLLPLLGWGVARSRTPAGPIEYDVGLADSAQLILGYSANFAAAPGADFMVHAGGQGLGLWRRSLRDGSTAPIPGAAGWGVRISPGGTRAAFATNEEQARLMVMQLVGGAVRDFGPQDINFLVWLSESRLLVIGGDGRTLHTFDVESGLLESRVIPYCIIPSWIPELELLLCGGGSRPDAKVVNPRDGTERPLRMAAQRAAAGADQRGTVPGSHFQVVDGRYLVHLSLAGDLRASRFDPATLTVGPPVTLVHGVRRENYTGAGQYDITADGTLLYVPGENAQISRFVTMGPSGAAEPLEIAPGAYLRFDLSRDARRLAVAAQEDVTQALYIIDLADGRRQTWLTAQHVGQPLWTPDGERLVVFVEDERGRGSVLVGSPTSARAADTLMTDVTIWFSGFERDGVVIGWNEAPMRLTLGPPARLDTLQRQGVFATVSPDGRWLAYEELSPWVMRLSPYPALDRRFVITRDGGDAQWLSDHEIVYWSTTPGVPTWYRVPIDPGAANPVGRPVLWFSDPRFADTPGRSHQVTTDGRILYLQGPPRTSAPFVRVVPGWVDRMKRAVDAAR